MKKILCLLFWVMLPLGGIHADTVLNKSVAIVNNQLITALDFERALNFAILEQQQSEQLKQDKAFRKAVFDHLVIETIVTQLAQLNHIEVDDGEVSQAVANIAARMSLSPEKFQQAIEQMGVKFSDYRARVRAQLLISKVQQNMVSGNIFFEPDEVKARLERLDDYYQDLAIYQLSHILLLPEEGETADDVLNRAMAIRKKVSDGDARFVELAKTVSKASDAKEGGKIEGPIDSLPRLFSSVINTLSVGDVAEPITQGDSVHLVMLLGKRYPYGDDPGMREEAARRSIFEEKARSFLAAWEVQIRKDAIVSVYDETLRGNN